MCCMQEIREEKNKMESRIQEYRGRRGRDRMVVGFTTTYAISAYRHSCCEFESRSGRGNHENIHQYSAQGIDIQSKLWTNVSQSNYLYSQ
jgi:hypothetical protein